MINRTALVASLLIGLALPVRAQTTAPANDFIFTPVPSDISRSDLHGRVDASIRLGVKFLLSRQQRDGSWPDVRGREDELGMTALVTLALLSCGETHQSPPVSRAIEYLKRNKPRSRNQTYTIGLRACVYSMLPEPLRREELRADLNWLRNQIIRTGDTRGMYDYGTTMNRGGDYSNSQYGVLGVWYAANAGLEVPNAYWKLVEEGWLIGQNRDGGWDYTPNRNSSYGSMTAAAIATLFITNDFLHAQQAQDLRKPVENKPLESALAWMALNFAANHNPRPNANPTPNQDLLDLIDDQPMDDTRNWLFYTLFGYERVGEASGLTRFGAHKWFDEGAQFLIRTQAYDGRWEGPQIGPDGDTAYALLFLSRGRAPVIVQKLQFDGRWNNRARDAAAFTRFMRRATERHVNWQIVSIDDSLAELREAPILYLASDTAVEFSEQQKAKLKTYIEQGGLLVCVNEGPGKAFGESIASMAEELFPAYSFRDVPQGHLIYSANFPATAANEPVRAMSNGLRELVVLYPSGDMSWKWQFAGGGFSPRSTPYATLANTWLYATDRANPRFKGEDTWIERNDGVTAQRTATVARIRHDFNWDPEPAGWQRLGNVLHNFDQCDLTIDAIGTLSSRTSAAPATQPAALDPQKHVLAHLTATQSIQLSPEMKQVLKRYIDAGGLLILDAAGGSPEAGGSFELLMRELYPTCVFGNIRLDHPIYQATAYGGQVLTKLNYRRSATLTPSTTPRLRGAVVDRKLLAILSTEDISGGLVAYSTAGLTGYTPQSATDLMRNIILWRSSAMR